MITSPIHEPTFSIEQAQRYVRDEASMKRRILYALLLFFDAGMVVLITALWTTESSLPLRTHLAFAGMLAIGLVWLALFGWVLTRHRPLFALDRVIAGRLGLAFTSLFLVWGWIITSQRGGWSAVLTVTLVGGTLVAVAAAVLARATRTRGALLHRRDELLARLASAR